MLGYNLYYPLEYLAVIGNSMIPVNWRMERARDQTPTVNDTNEYSDPLNAILIPIIFSANILTYFVTT